MKNFWRNMLENLPLAVTEGGDRTEVDAAGIHSRGLRKARSLSLAGLS
jgi:hypothetical protein